MPGFDNGIVYGAGDRLTPSSAADILRMQQASTDVANINYTGNPEGAVAANPSSLSHDPVSGSIYRKATGTGNTGWALMDSEVPIGQMAYFPTANNTTYPNPNWLLCDGSAVSQATYPTLYQRVGLINEAGTNFAVNVTATITQIQVAVAFGNSVFTSIGQAGSVYTTTDGITWTSRTSGTASSLRTITYGGGIFVYGGFGGVLATSTDGVTWTARTSGTTSTIFTVVYENSLYVYGTVGGGLSTSTDAITWTARTSGTASTIITVTYNNSLYLYGGGAGAYATSTDAITWTPRTIPVTTSILALWYGNSSYYLNAFNAAVLTSTDAITWTRPRQDVSNFVLPSTTTKTIVLNINGTYLAVSPSAQNAWTSTDGQNFKYQTLEITQTAGPTLSYVAWDGANKLVGVGALGSNFYGSVYSYNTATQFKLPKQYYTNQNLQDNTFSNLYIKAL